MRHFVTRADEGLGLAAGNILELRMWNPEKALWVTMAQREEGNLSRSFASGREFCDYLRDAGSDFAEAAVRVRGTEVIVRFVKVRGKCYFGDEVLEE